MTFSHIMYLNFISQQASGMYNVYLYTINVHIYTLITNRGLLKGYTTERRVVIAPQKCFRGKHLWR